MWIIKDNEPINIDLIFHNREDYDSFTSMEEAAKQKPLNLYFSKELQKQAGVTDNQIKHWTMTGVIVPHKSVQGTGKMHTYDHQNLIEAMICRELQKYSMNYNLMKDVLSCLREKKWTFRFCGKLHVAPAQSKRNKTTNDNSPKASFDPIIKEHSFWEFIKIYPQDTEILLALWKDSSLPISSEPKTDEYCIDVKYDGLGIITSLRTSMVIINLSRLLEEAGNFYKEEVE